MKNRKLIRDVFRNKASMMVYSLLKTLLFFTQLKTNVNLIIQIYGVQWVGKSYIYACGTQKNSALIYDRGTLKAIGGLVDLNNAITSIDNDGIGELPTLMAASEKRLFILKNKTFNPNLAR